MIVPFTEHKINFYRGICNFQKGLLTCHCRKQNTSQENNTRPGSHLFVFDEQITPGRFNF